MVEVGQLAIKIAGRDAGRECLIVQKIDDNFVMVDGNTRRRKCNVDHLEFSSQKAALKEGASHEEVAKALQSLGVKMLVRAPPRQKKEATKAEAKPAPVKSTKAPANKAQTKKAK